MTKSFIRKSARSNFNKTIVLLLILILPVMGFILGKSYQNKMNSRSTSIQKNVSLKSSGEWRTYTHEKIPLPTGWSSYPWVGFKLHYPPTWKVEEEKQDDSTGIYQLRVTKADGSFFTVLQGFGEGGTCLFPDDPNYNTFQGMGSQYNSYIQMDKSDLKMRLALYKDSSNSKSFSLCQLQNGTYYNANVIGITAINLTTKQSEEEFKEMLQKLEIL